MIAICMLFSVLSYISYYCSQLGQSSESKLTSSINFYCFMIYNQEVYYNKLTVMLTTAVQKHSTYSRLQTFYYDCFNRYNHLPQQLKKSCKYGARMISPQICQIYFMDDDFQDIIGVCQINGIQSICYLSVVVGQKSRKVVYYDQIGHQFVLLSARMKEENDIVQVKEKSRVIFILEKQDQISNISEAINVQGCFFMAVTTRHREVFLLTIKREELGLIQLKNDQNLMNSVMGLFTTKKPQTTNWNQLYLIQNENHNYFHLLHLQDNLLYLRIVQLKFSQQETQYFVMREVPNGQLKLSISTVKQCLLAQDYNNNLKVLLIATKNINNTIGIVRIEVDINGQNKFNASILADQINNQQHFQMSVCQDHLYYSLRSQGNIHILKTLLNGAFLPTIIFSFPISGFTLHSSLLKCYLTLPTCSYLLQTFCEQQPQESIDNAELAYDNWQDNWNRQFSHSLRQAFHEADFSRLGYLLQQKEIALEKKVGVFQSQEQFKKVEEEVCTDLLTLRTFRLIIGSNLTSPDQSSYHQLQYMTERNSTEDLSKQIDDFLEERNYVFFVQFCKIISELSQQQEAYQKVGIKLAGQQIVKCLDLLMGEDDSYLAQLKDLLQHSLKLVPFHKKYYHYLLSKEEEHFLKELMLNNNFYPCFPLLYWHQPCPLTLTQLKGFVQHVHANQSFFEQFTEQFLVYCKRKDIKPRMKEKATQIMHILGSYLHQLQPIIQRTFPGLLYFSHLHNRINHTQDMKQISTSIKKVDHSHTILLSLNPPSKLDLQTVKICQELQLPFCKASQLCVAIKQGHFKNKELKMALWKPFTQLMQKNNHKQDIDGCKEKLRLV